jgi:hypothetical protein
LPRGGIKVGSPIILEIFRGDEILIKEGTKEDRPRTSQIVTRKDVRQVDDQHNLEDKKDDKNGNRARPSDDKKSTEEQKVEKGRWTTTIEKSRNLTPFDNRSSGMTALNTYTRHNKSYNNPMNEMMTKTIQIPNERLFSSKPLNHTMKSNCTKEMSRGKKTNSLESSIENQMAFKKVFWLIYFRYHVQFLNPKKRPNFWMKYTTTSFC